MEGERTCSRRHCVFLGTVVSSQRDEPRAIIGSRGPSRRDVGLSARDHRDGGVRDVAFVTVGDFAARDELQHRGRWRRSGSYYGNDSDIGRRYRCLAGSGRALEHAQHFTDQAAVLAERLGMQVRFAHIYALPGATAATPLREHGVALLSRYPIVAYTNHSITRLSTQAEGSPPAPMPGFLEATVDVRGTRVRVFNTHLDFRPDPAVRRQQVDETLAIIGHPSAPTLLFGDLNAPPGAPELQPIFKQLRDSWVVSADSGFTYSATAPVRRIDYVFSSSHFRVSAVAVFESLASDHRPVIIDLVVDPARK